MNINLSRWQEINEKATHEASNALSKLIGLPITIGTVHLEVKEVSTLFSFIAPHDLVVLMEVPFTGEIQGKTLLLMPQQTALGLSKNVLSQAQLPWQAVLSLTPRDEEVLKEVGNIVIGNYLKALSASLEGKTILHGLSRLSQGEFQTTVPPVLFSLNHCEDKGVIIEVVFGFKETSLTGTIFLVFEGIEQSPEKKRLEMIFAKTKIYIESVLNSVLDPIIVINYDGIIQIANPATIRMLGFDEESDLVGKPLGIILKREEEFLCGTSVEKMARTGSLSLLEGKFYGKNSNPVSVLISEGEMRDGEQKLIGFVIVAKDISELKKVERIKDDFISTVSHELRTPLTVIKSALDNLKDGLVGDLLPAQSVVVDMSVRNCSRLSHLIDNLLDLSRLEAKDSKILPSRISLPSLVDEIVGGFRIMVNGTGNSIPTEVVVCLPADLPQVYADREMMARVLTNLLQNAIHFASRQVVVTGEKGPENFVTLSVTDDGHGISLEQQKKLFKKFIQLDRPRGGAGYKGTGLGLAICREIVEKNGGKIWVESKLEQGAVFRFTIPVAQK